MEKDQNKPDIESLITAYNNFNQIIEKFQNTFLALQSKVDLLTKQLETKNRELEKKYIEGETIKKFLNSILDNIYNGVIAIDQRGLITHFNKAAEQITGFHKEDFLGKNYKAFDNSKNTESRSALYTLTTLKESFHRQKNIITSDKQEKRIEFNTTLLRNNEQQIIGVVETINDISEIKVLQDRISHVETLAALGEMSASVAHEIRNPLAGITGFAGLLDRQIPDEDPKKPLIKSVLSGTTKLNGIITNLLTLTRPQQLKLQEVFFVDFINDVVNYFRENFVLEDKKMAINLELDQPQTKITVDVHLFQQVLLNLLKNAYDAISKKGKITIKTKTSIFKPDSAILEDDEISEMMRLFSDLEIEISDNGAGMTDDVAAKIFNPFFTTKNEGNGLGLAICKKIIQLHKGDIHVTSKVGKGTTFMINLPLYEQPE